VTEFGARARRHRRPRLLVGATAALVVGLAVVGALWWFGPRHQVPVPGPDATPAQVVAAYHEAIEARDFDTANAIDDRPGSTLSRFSLPVTFVNVDDVEARVNGANAYVQFSADVKHNDGSFNDPTVWGYYLERTDGGWHITAEGVG
jgi:hypothetical protein